MTSLETVLDEARDAITVRRVYGEPYEADGITIIPAAAVRGGGGGGEGGSADEDHGSGAGFGVTARPVGAYRVKDGDVSWVPAPDTTRVIIMTEILAIVGFLVVRSIMRHRNPSG